MTAPTVMEALQERFADEEGVSLSGLRGEVFDPRYAFRRDPYALVPREQGGSYAGRLRDHIDTVEIISAARFSNSLCQLSNAIAFADLLSNGGRRQVSLRLPEFWYMPKEKINLFGSVVLSNCRSASNDGDLTIRGSFFYLSTLRPMFPAAPVRYEELQRIAQHISIPRHVEALSDDDLVVHLRSGDVFVGRGEHPEYGQPPLAYYRRIVNSRRWRSVRLVFEDRGNVVIDPLIEFIEGVGIPVLTYSGTLEQDLSILLAAKTLVAGIGTFIPGVVSISRNVKTVYAFEKYNDWGNRSLSVIRCEDTEKGYVAAVLSSNWKNLTEQRELMLSYPDENIVVPNR